MNTTSIAGMLLADSRFPAGGHAYSGGVEPAAAAGIVTDLTSLHAFLRGRLQTAGLVAAGLAAAACALADSTRRGTAGESAHTVPDELWAALDVQSDARTPSPAQREASRRQGRALLRAARAAWPDDLPLADLAAATRTTAARGANGATGTTGYRSGPHHAVVLGAAAAAAGCSPAEAARIAAYQAVAGPTSAAVRLLALDPMRATAMLARLTADIDQVAADAATHSSGPLDDLPCPSAPALDLLAEAHSRAEVRLFES